MRDLSTLRVGDVVKLKHVDDMYFVLDGGLTFKEALASGLCNKSTYDTYALFSNKTVEIAGIDEFLHFFSVKDENGRLTFCIGDIAVWPDEQCVNNVNITDIMEFLDGEYDGV